jgi:hypothetical protein
LNSRHPEAVILLNQIEYLTTVDLYENGRVSTGLLAVSGRHTLVAKKAGQGGSKSHANFSKL